MEEPGRADQLTVLVIDDEPQVCNLIASAFTRRGDVVVTASSAEEGLEQLPYFTFQVAFVDHHQDLAALSGLLAARVLGVSLPRRRDGTTLFAHYDQIMRAKGRCTEFSG